MGSDCFSLSCRRPSDCVGFCEHMETSLKYCVSPVQTGGKTCDMTQHCHSSVSAQFVCFTHTCQASTSPQSAARLPANVHSPQLSSVSWIVFASGNYLFSPPDFSLCLLPLEYCLITCMDFYSPTGMIFVYVWQFSLGYLSLNLCPEYSCLSALTCLLPSYN